MLPLPISCGGPPRSTRSPRSCNEPPSPTSVSELARRLEKVRNRLRDPAVRILVVGEFKQGKSSLINSLLNARVCPVDDDIATSAPTMVRYGEEPSASVLYQSTDPDADSTDLLRQQIPIDDVRFYATEGANPDNERRVHSVEIQLSRPLLAEGVVLIDTPGVGGLRSAHGKIAVGVLPLADVVLFVSDASQEFSEPELAFLEQARDACPNVVYVQTKIDLFPEWRFIRSTNEAHLARRGVSAVVHSVSSKLRVHALESADRELNRESGFPELIQTLRGDVLDAAGKVIRDRTGRELLDVTDRLAEQLNAQRLALTDPEQAGGVMNDLQEAKERAANLRERVASWQQVLGDGVADLNADVDHDLRHRFRSIIEDSEGAIDESDPAEVWPEIEEWLKARAAEDVVHHYAWVRQLTEQLAENVAASFDDEAGQLSEAFELIAPPPVPISSQLDNKDFERQGAGATALTAARGSYGGVIMVSMAGIFIPVVGQVMAPASFALGVILGRKAMKEERERQLKIRQAEAKQSVRRYTDEVSFAVSKHSRDTLRLTQRQMRDHFRERADELHKSMSDTLQKMQVAAKADEKSRAGQLRDVDAELKRVSALRERVIDVLSGGTDAVLAPQPAAAVRTS